MISKLYEEHLRKDLSRLAVLSLVTVVIWISVSVYKTLNKSQLAPDVKKQILPLTTSIDLDTMEAIKQRQTVPPADWNSLGSSQTVDILLPPEPEATASAVEFEPVTIPASGSAEASPSGDINL